MNNCYLTPAISAQCGNINVYVAGGVDNKFKNNVLGTLQSLSGFSSKTQRALSGVKNVIILKNSESPVPEEFQHTRQKLEKHAGDAYGFVCKSDSAIVINEQNHQRKDASLEGNIETQASDTLSHEVGHLIDEEYSTSKKFQQAYLADLKDIEKKLHDEEQSGSNGLGKMVSYLKHYMEGVDFSDGIDENDISREGLRENFAECFSTIADEHPSEINSIFASLFPRSMEQTLNFVI